jgi:hypothetical protein
VYNIILIHRVYTKVEGSMNTTQKLDLSRKMVMRLERKLSDAREAINYSEPPPIAIAEDRVIMTKDCYNKIVVAINMDSL